MNENNLDVILSNSYRVDEHLPAVEICGQPLATIATKYLPHSKAVCYFSDHAIIFPCVSRPKGRHGEIKSTESRK